MGKPSNVQFEPLHNICCVYDENLSKMANFKSILEFMKRLPIQKALTNQHLVFQSHIERFWENATYDKESKTINSIVSMNGQDKPIIITEQLVREVINFPDDENSPTKFPERMVKGCMLRMGYNGPLNKANYLKACFPKPYKFLIHSVLHALSHRKGGYDTMRDYQMNMVTALVLNKKYNFSKIVFHYMVENITSKSKTWVYPRFVQMILDHAYPYLERDENNDLLVLGHMNNEMLKQLPRYHPNHPEPSTKADFFGFIKDKNYVDPDPVEHQKWRNEKEMKEASYANELKILAYFKESRNEWFLKEEKKKRSRKATPKVQVEEGSSSQPKKKRQRRVVETMLVDESDKEDEAEAEANVEGDVRLSPESAKFLKSLNKYNAEKEKTAGDEEGDDVDKSSSSASDEDMDETERAKRIRVEIEKEKQLKRREEKEDDPYIPSPEHVIESQTPPSSGGRKKASARNRVVTPSAARRKLIVKLPKRTPKSKPPTPPKQPTPPPSPPPGPQQQPSPIQSPLHQSPSRQPTPQIHPSPLHLSPPHRTPIQEQPVVTSQQIFQTPPLTQPPVQTTPGSSGYKTFPHVPEGITLEEIGDFGFANDEQVKRLEMEEVLVDNKRLVDREKKLEKRVKSVEAENSSLLKKIEADQAEIDILKVKVAELEEEKARRDEQNKYFELKNKVLEAAKAMKEHEIYMMNKVLENLLGKSVEQKFEEIKIEEVRARRQEPEVEEGEIRHTYTMNDIIEMTRY
ncbi:putative transcription factor bZIP family [Helianthus anomalus]